MRRHVRLPVLCCIGGLLYLLVELAWRGYTHWTMFLVGGISFVLIGCINEVLPWEMPFLNQCTLGAFFITTVELVAGIIINLWLGWDVWDYFAVPFNLWGQICLPYSILWCVASAIAIVLDDYLRYWLFGEEKPKYKL